MDFKLEGKISVLLEEIRNPVSASQIILMLCFHVQIEIVPDKEPEIITEHFKPAILCECTSTLFNGKNDASIAKRLASRNAFPNC